jgi:hypothetical protein
MTEGQLENRKTDIGSIEDQYREKMKLANGIQIGRKDVISKWTTKTVITTEKGKYLKGGKEHNSI